MKLLTALKSQPADNCVVLTYNANLLFFEYTLFEPLYAAGCRNTLVLCDPHQYELALADTPLLRYAGQRYLFQPARTSPSGAFHPKLILLTSAHDGRLFLASSNLTRAGYARNWEVVTLFEYNAKKPDPTAWMACRWALDTLLRIVDESDVGGLAYQRLDQLLGTSPWLRQEMSPPPSAAVWLLHNLDEPLLDQLVARYHEDDGSPVGEIVIVSPFFDAGGRAIAELLARCRPPRVSLYSQAVENGLDPRALDAVLQAHDVEFHLGQLDIDRRRLHAKMLLLRTRRGAWLVTGSANLSAPAWLHPAASGNTEIVTLRFESDPTHFNPWLDELVAYTRPLDLDWDVSPPETKPQPTETVAPLTLLSAMLKEGHLVMRLAERLPTHAPLTTRLTAEESLEIVYERWRQEADHALTLPLASRYLPQLETPTLVALETGSPSDRVWSNRVLLENLGALRRFGRPIERRERPRVPEGMVPESYEHCAQLLEMLHDLLATGPEQLHRHRGRIAALAQAERQERQMAVEEEGEYRPEDHFVEERVRLAPSSSGADVYVDFYDRLTYEELLRAALAATYRPIPSSTDGRQPDESPAPRPAPEPEPAIAPEDEALRTQWMARIERGFNRLVSNFAQGAADADYLAEVPPRYLIEVFVIVTAYLRIVWRDGKLREKPFVDHSLDLLVGFWGRPGHSAAWQVLRPRLTEADLKDEEARLGLSAQAWIHAYVVAGLLADAGDRRVYDLAAWMRELGATLKGPEALAALPDRMYRWLWRASLPSGVQFRPASDVVLRLHDLSRCYDETSLLAEIGSWSGARARTSLGTVARVRNVPRLEATLPLSEADVDRCLRAFALFVIWPRPKKLAWSRFTNANPLERADDVECITTFYREDESLLVLGVRRASGEHRPELHRTGVTPEYLGKLGSVAQLYSLPPAQVE